MPATTDPQTVQEPLETANRVAVAHAAVVADPKSPEHVRASAAMALGRFRGPVAAAALEGHKVAPGVRVMVVPGSEEVKKEAEREGLGEIFKAAGAEWREAGCSMCIAMNGDQLELGQYAISTSNRNFEGRQGKGGRTHLVSPLMAAAAAIEGHFVDIRQWDVEQAE